MNKDVEKPEVTVPDPVKVTVPPTVLTPVAPKSVNDAKEATITKALNKPCKP